jgi:hypothetical protein
MTAVKLSKLRTGHLYPPGNIPGTHFCYRLSRPRGHSAFRRIVSMKNSNDTIGNRTRDLPACSIVSQLTAPSRAPSKTTVGTSDLTSLILIIDMFITLCKHICKLRCDSDLFIYLFSLQALHRIVCQNQLCSTFFLFLKNCFIQSDSFGTRPKKMRISQRLFIIQFNIL